MDTQVSTWTMTLNLGLGFVNVLFGQKENFGDGSYLNFLPFFSSVIEFFFQDFSFCPTWAKLTISDHVHPHLR